MKINSKQQRADFIKSCLREEHHRDPQEIKRRIRELDQLLAAKEIEVIYGVLGKVSRTPGEQARYAVIKRMLEHAVKHYNGRRGLQV